jgi:two-component system, chemotaxis family, protein-glutamate methylesterase/glutaminase
MRGHDVVVIGGSAGAIGALQELITHLPPELPVSLLAVLHLSHDATSVPLMLRQADPYRVRFARDGDRLAPGEVLLAPPNEHLAVDQARVRLARGPRENFWRPSIDVLFRTAAVSHASRVAGLLLSGALDDGVAGLQAIQRCGGQVLVQDPEEAAYPDLPRHALQNVPGIRALRVRELAGEIARLASEPPGPESDIPPDLLMEARIATHPTQDATDAAFRELTPTVYTCPECSGPLSRASNGERYRCRVGHAYGSETLLDQTRHQIESSLWSAVRLHEQRATLSRARAVREEETGREHAAASYTARARESEQHAARLRELLVRLAD